MIKKLKAVIGSLRFWMVLLGSVIFYLGSVGVISPALADAIIGLLGVSTLVRTVDKFR